MHILILGAGAGGGLPQWNCNCGNCRAARLTARCEGVAPASAVKPRSQSSLAVSADGENWFLLNASPDLRQQIFDNPQLHPRQGLRHSPIAGVVLTNADVDHVTGLLTLREQQALSLYATARVQGVVRANCIFNVLNPKLAQWTPLALETPIALKRPDGEDSGLTVTPFATPGKVALWLEDPALANFGSIEEDTIGLKIEANGKSFFYAPGCATLPLDLAQRLTGADLVFFDGTTFTDDEMIVLGLGEKTGKRMGHMSMSGEDGSIAAFAPLGVKRKIFIHINNSNPVWRADAAERAAVRAAGWEIADDGMEIVL